MNRLNHRYLHWFMKLMWCFFFVQRVTVFTVDTSIVWFFLKIIMQSDASEVSVGQDGYYIVIIISEKCR